MSHLDEMDIDSNEDQELILSEIYALQNPGDGDLELSMLGKHNNKTQITKVILSCGDHLFMPIFCLSFLNSKLG